jgi:hypothetical protein
MLIIEFIDYHTHCKYPYNNLGELIVLDHFLFKLVRIRNKVKIQFYGTMLLVTISYLSSKCIRCP